jgi:transposase
MRDVLNAKQQRAAQLRGRGWSLREIAKELGVPERTLIRWNRIPAFRVEREHTGRDDHREAAQPAANTGGGAASARQS